MSAGGYSAGGNQANVIVVIIKEPLTDNRKYIFKREPYLTYYVLHDGKLEADSKYRKISTDIRLGDYDEKKLFH